MKKINLVVIFFLAICHMTSCKKDSIETDPKDERYPIDFKFINTTENVLRVVNFGVGVSFPIEYESTLKSQHFPKVQPHDTLFLRVDTTKGYGNFGYIGCATQISIDVYYKLNDSMIYASGWRTKTDTIRSKADAKVFFYWPNDTLYCDKIIGYIIYKQGNYGLFDE
jgi:hypothetical protein